MSLAGATSDDPPRFLLLLPPPPSPLNAAALRAAYGSTLSEVLKEVAMHSAGATRPAVLEIALACSHLVDARKHIRSALYHQTQSVVSAVYKLVVIVAAQEGINIEDSDGVDVRVLLIAWADGVRLEESPTSPHGPIVDLATLARSGRQWQYAFGVESEAGESMVREFVTAKGSPSEVSRVQSDSIMNRSEASEATTSTAVAMAPRLPTHDGHYHVAVGGTWDHLHIGHKLLITMTIFAVDDARDEGHERTATIGITGDQLLVQKKHANLVESWTDRQKAVATFFNAIVNFSQPTSPGQRHVSISDDPEPNGKSLDVHYPNGLIVKCTEIQDPFGPTITVERISALVISAETRSGGKAVNDKRREQGWKELEIFEVDVLDTDEDDQTPGVKEGFDSKISSTAIREKIARKSGGKM